MNPKIIAFDFDGVICNGLVEYFATTKKTYLQIWQPTTNQNLDEFAESFYYLRPVIEVGWEMPVLLRALILGIDRTEILNNWHEVAKKITTEENLDDREISNKLDRNRDVWIEQDLQGWLDLHQFYPGIISTLKQINSSAIAVYIITTKEGRFAKKLLEQKGINLADEYIIGKESQRSKDRTLKLLLEKNNLSEDNSIWFIEDRLKTLEKVQQNLGLSTIKLLLADWGYNTEAERTAARNNPDIEVLSLEQFQQKFVAS